MLTALVLVFVAAYAAIVLEHPLKINKSASALIGAGLLWTIYALPAPGEQELLGQLGESLTATAQVVFFLLGAMAIVEMIDAHGGFEVITSRIRTKSLSTLVWVAGITAFFLSSILDNLTTTIVMISLMRKILAHKDDRLFFAGVIVIAANAGGAWTPIGDVTTTMLWIAGRITTVEIMKGLFVPSLINLIVPLAAIGWSLRGRKVEAPAKPEGGRHLPETTVFERNAMFFCGLGILVLVPVFKAATHLPPYMGILFGLGLLWLLGDIIHRDKPDHLKEHLTLTRALSRIDTSSLTFFIGILLAVAVLEHSGLLASLAKWLDVAIGRQDIIVLVIGLVSAIVDNVPLVAASIGMYSLADYPVDSFLWEFLAYCAGTGGSILIIGSAAGVAAMGLEKISFFWYLRRISGYALLGYFAGAICYLLTHHP
ncbi:MAG: sodium:proton antiporter NhaD [Chthoniobacterales bacterium]|nr:sodium:proton antiporter NhaD [Chthoniobacterales bacterium]